MISLHDLRCFNDPCVCEPVYVRETARTSVRLWQNRFAGLSCEPDTMRDGPDVRLSPGVGAVRVSRRLRP